MITTPAEISRAVGRAVSIVAAVNDYIQKVKRVTMHSLTRMGERQLSNWELVKTTVPLPLIVIGRIKLTNEQS